MISYSVLQSQILKTIRGSLSQENFARRIGTDSGQVIRWEKGHAKISWLDFLHIASKFKLEVRYALQSVLVYEDQDLSSHLIFRHLWKTSTYPEIHKRTGFSKAKISRLQNAKGKASLVDLLKVIDSAARSLDSFIGRMLKDLPTPEVLLKHQKYNRTLVDLIYDRPWIAALNRFLDTQEYLESDGGSAEYLASCLKISVLEVRNALSDLQSAGLVVENETGKYQCLNSNLLGQGHRAGEMQLRHYWTQKSLVFLENKMKNDDVKEDPIVWSYMVLSVSREAKKEIEDRLIQLFHDVNDIVQKDKKTADDVFLYNLQFIPVKKLP